MAMLKSVGLILILLWVGCAKPYSTQISPVAALRQDFTPQMKATFHGKYRSACHETEFRGMNVYEVSDEMYAEGSKFMKWSRFYSDGNCQVPFAQGKVEGQFEFFNNPSGPADFGMLYLYSHYLVMPETKQIAMLMTSASFCGHQDWRAGNFMNILTRPESAAIWMAPGDDHLSTLYRTECSLKQVNHCVQILLTRAQGLSETPENP